MRHTIENEFLKVEISEFGAILAKLIDKKTNHDFVLGFESDQEYIDCGGNLSMCVGRNANRIGNAKFSLNGVEYKLSVNDNMNQLHGGGVNGFGYKNWTVKDLKQDAIVLYYDAKDLEEGFPGNCHAEVEYKLDNNNLIITFTGTSDKDTIFNMTNHAYFTLGKDKIYDDELKVETDKYSPTDKYSLTLDEVKDVRNTPFDFTEFTRIGDQLSKLENGIDHNYVWENMNDKLMCSYRNENHQLNVYSDLPDMHIYTANYLGDVIGKYGKKYSKQAAICFECQFYPNGINYDNYIKPILKANDVSKHYMRLEIK